MISSGTKILLCHASQGGHYFLPGGHVEIFEDAPTALKRELKEELNATVKNLHFIGLVENIYRNDKERRHEINIIFRVKLKKNKSLSKENHITFRWVEISRLLKIDALPKVLFRAIQKFIKDKKIFFTTVDEIQRNR